MKTQQVCNFLDGLPSIVITSVASGGEDFLNIPCSSINYPAL